MPMARGGPPGNQGPPASRVLGGQVKGLHTRGAGGCLHKSLTQQPKD